MKKSNFLEEDYIKKLLLFDIYDVDEFVLREVENIKKNNLLDVFDVGNARRCCFEVIQVGDYKFEKGEITTAEYLERIDLGDTHCFTELNYNEFNNDDFIEYLDQYYSDKWLHDYQYNKFFLPLAIKWIKETEGDISKKMRLEQVNNILIESQFSLRNIEKNRNGIEPINEIQTKVIHVFKEFVTLMLDGLKNHFKDFFDLNSLHKDSKSNSFVSFDKPHSDIFIKVEIYRSALKYIDKHIVELYPDISYLMGIWKI